MKIQDLILSFGNSGGKAMISLYEFLELLFVAIGKIASIALLIFTLRGLNKLHTVADALAYKRYKYNLMLIVYNMLLLFVFGRQWYNIAGNILLCATALFVDFAIYRKIINTAIYAILNGEFTASIQFVDYTVIDNKFNNRLIILCLVSFVMSQALTFFILFSRFL